MKYLTIEKKKKRSPNKGSSLLQEVSNIKEIDMLIIQEHIDERLDPLRLEHSDKPFVVISYYKWAANRILELLIEEALRLPSYISGREYRSSSDIITEFIEYLDYACVISGNSRSRFVFSSAKTEAENILNLITNR